MYEDAANVRRDSPGAYPFFALEFCASGSLADRLDGTPLPARSATQLIEVLALAIEAAHRAHVIHRDLKLANVLFAEDGTPKITDFGLAKKLDEAGQTQTGAIMGTPSYMAPEQAGGPSSDVGPAADVYALGATLYECLTGRPPFKAATPMDTVLQLLADEPVPPRRLQPTVPRDLELICLKCLEKESRRRYPSAAALADDLHAFLQGAPIQARPIGLLLRGAKWARRRPALAAVAVSSTVAMLAAVGALVGLWYSGQLQQANSRLEVAAEDARQQREQAERLRAVAESEKAKAQEQRQRAEALKAEADRQRGQAEEQSRRARLFEYAADINLAHQAWQEGQVARLRGLLERSREAPEQGAGPHGFEWHYLQSLASSELLNLPRQAMTASKELLTIANLGSSAATFSPDSQRLAVGCDDARSVGTVKVWDLSAKREVLSLPGPTASIKGVVFSPDGSYLAAYGSERTVRVWKADTGRLAQALQGHEMMVAAIAFSPDGRRLASAGGLDQTVKVWDMSTGQELLSLRGHTGAVRAVAFSPDGRRLATGSADRTIRLWGPSPAEAVRH